MKQEVKIEGMSCAGCANSVKVKFEKIKGIEAVEIDLANNTAILTAEYEIPEDSLQVALEDTNYRVI